MRLHSALHYRRRPEVVIRAILHASLLDVFRFPAHRTCLFVRRTDTNATFAPRPPSLRGLLSELLSSFRALCAASPSYQRLRIAPAGCIMLALLAAQWKEQERLTGPMAVVVAHDRVPGLDGPPPPGVIVLPGIDVARPERV